MNLYYFHPVLFTPIRTEEVPDAVGDDIPSDSTPVAWPTCVEFEIPVFNPLMNDWTVASDYRKATLYSTQNGTPINVGDFDIGRTLTELNATTQPRPSGWHHWQDNAWVDDVDRRSADMAANARTMRDQLLRAALDMADRHRNQKEIGRPTTISEEDYIAVLGYLEDLRDLPDQAGFPHDIAWPNVPAPLLGTLTNMLG